MEVCLEQFTIPKRKQKGFNRTIYLFFPCLASLPSLSPAPPPWKKRNVSAELYNWKKSSIKTDYQVFQSANSNPEAYSIFGSGPLEEMEKIHKGGIYSMHLLIHSWVVMSPEMANWLLTYWAEASEEGPWKWPFCSNFSPIRWESSPIEQWAQEKRRAPVTLLVRQYGRWELSWIWKHYLVLFVFLLVLLMRLIPFSVQG